MKNKFLLLILRAHLALVLNYGHVFTSGLKSPWGIHSLGQSIRRNRKTTLYNSPPRGGDIVGEEQNKQMSNKPQPCIDFPERVLEPKYGLMFIDKFCHYHGGYLAAKASDVYGVAILNSLSTYVSGYMEMTAAAQRDPEDDESEQSQPPHLKMKLPSPDELEEWKAGIPFEVMGIICESDSGLEEAELVGEAIGVRFHNGFNPARRDKFLMNDAVSNKGMRVVKQRMCGSVDEAIEFAKELGVSSISSTDNNENASSSASTKGNEIESGSTSGQSNEESNRGHLGRGSNTPIRPSSDGKFCVIKPKRGVASDDVQFCSNLDDVKVAFERVQGTSVFGSITGERNDAVLVQEFAAGTEYAIDIISKDGHHKVAALWRYDKREANGAPFVYFATELVDAQTPEGKLVCDYAMKALDALDLKHGLTHSEFIVDEEGVRLVEVNCRQHNTNFAPLTMAAIGYNALDLLLAIYLGDLPDLPIETEHLRLEWDDVPDLPTTRACGAVVHLVCFQEGELIKINNEVLEEIDNLPSVYMMEIYDHFEVGSQIEKTIDIRSDSGWIHLINDDEEQFKKDYSRIVELMPQMFTVREE